MNILLRTACQSCILLGFPLLASSATVFQDGFESGSLGPAWSVSTTVDGRVTVTSGFEPASGQHHLVLDDSVNDALYSVAACTIRLELSHKKNVMLSFKAKSLGDEPHWTSSYSAPPEPPSFDGISVSTDGGAHWRCVQTLTDLSATWNSYSIRLDYGYYYYDPPWGGPDVRIRFSQYDNASAPLDGIAIDDVQVTAEDDQRAVLEIPARLAEGSGPHVGSVLLAFAPTNDLTLTLVASPADQLVVPASVVVPAGQKQASFSFSVANDSLVNLTRSVSLSASASSARSIPSYVTILDDDAPVVTLNVPAQLTEGVLTNDNALITLDRAPDVPFSLYLDAVPYSEVSLTYSVTIPAGQTQAVFTVNAEDDSRIDGNVPVTLIARGDSALDATNQVMTVDNETRMLSLLLPATVQEGSMATGTVSMAGTLLTNLNVRLTSSSAAALTVPPGVTIVAGETQAAFPMAAADNSLREGSRSVTINAMATTFAGASQTLTIRDNEVAGYRFGALSNIVNVSGPLDITVLAADVEGNAVSDFTGTVNLSVALPNGTTLPLTPAAVDLSGTTGWVGNVTFPTVNASPLRLRATDENGNSSDSVPFDLMRLVDLAAADLTAADLVWDSFRNRFYASVPSSAGGTNANRVVVIDPARAEITGSVLLAQDPGRLALTSGGENLYVALNGNGNIVRMDPASMTVFSTFPVGTDPAYGTFYVGDMCPVAGQPDLLMVSRTGPSGYEHFGVAAYENGVARLTNTPFHYGSRVIEPSADPTVFFGYDNQNDHGFRRLQLDASGITEIEVNQTLLPDYNADILSDGNKVFSTSGAELDGAQMRRLGTFPVSGVLRPNLAAHRVYFIEQQDSNWWSLYDKISAYDPVTFSSIRKLTMSSPVLSPAGLIRWGTNGLAFLTSSNVVLINSSQLVPSDLPANLSVAIAVSPNPTRVNVPLTYTLTVSNQGPNIARNAILEAELSAHQTIQSVLTANGTPGIFSNSISLLIGDLVPGDIATLAVTSRPQSAGSLVCTATAISDPPDLDFSDNTATQLVSAGYQLTLDVVSELRLAANNLLYDPTRNLLWASVPESDLHLGESVVAINPLTGVISESIPIGGSPQERCMALSANGRYLYVGLAGLPAVHRIDLASGNTSIRIALDDWGSPDYARDIEPLDGDGTSLLVATHSGVSAFDGATRRTNRISAWTSRVEKTAAPATFVGTYYDSMHRLLVGASGVVLTQSVSDLVPGSWDIRGDGNLVLSSSGHLINSSNLTLRANFGISGSPCLDLPHHRAYLVNDNVLHGFDTETLLATGDFALPATWYGNGSETCVRWGLDGFAIRRNDGLIYVLRWSSTIPAATDANADGMSDAWEAIHFGTLDVDSAGDGDGDGLRNFQEYLFVTSPVQASASPLQVSTATVGEQTALRLVFPRRAGLSPQPYTFVTSSDLNHWATASGVSETVLATQTVDGVQVETVEAIIPISDPISEFVRFRWTPH